MLPLAHALCPACGRGLDLGASPIACNGCQQTYPCVGGVPVLLPEPERHVALWRAQLGLLLERGQKTLEGLTQAASSDGLSPLTAGRLRALGQAVKEQVSDIAAVLDPALGGPAAPAGGLPRGVVEYIAYLYRDWGWPSVGYRENDAPLATLAALLGERRLGRMLVLGAGACGLAYELHLKHGASATVALDIDPYLLLIAERVVRGEQVRLTEASLKVLDVADVSRSWALTAPSGALSAAAFQCLFADGTAPPFASGSFDSVVTPWFIDQVPRDLPAFVATVARLLAPGGLWLNQGPLIYPEQIPFERRYSADELFELTAAAGFELLGSARAAQPYLVSPLAGHGKLETVLSFAAELRPHAAVAAAQPTT